MKSSRASLLPLAAALLLLGAFSSGCSRQSRGNADAQPGGKAAADGPGASTQGSAGQAKDFGDTDAKKKFDEASPEGRSTVGTGSTNGPGARERKDVTIERPAPQSAPQK
jgi:hypothetical protein